MSLKDDLIAAKALIDTPEKWDANQRLVTHALNDAIRDDEAFIAARNFLRRLHGGLLVGLKLHSHEAALSLFDRAIAAAGDQS